MEPQTRTPLFEKRPTESEAKDHSSEESSTHPKTNPDQQQPITPDGDSTTCRVILSQLIIPDGDLRKYLSKQLSVQRLNDIHLHLWWAGRPDNIRPLHAQKMMKRDIVITENIDLHLIWFDTTIYIKPLPAFIIDWDFFKTNICPDEDLYKLANGFLKTYTKLIQYPSDLKIALDMGLVPNTIKWSFWSEFSTMLQPKIDDFQINKRYTFGELRLRRLNHVYRFLRWGGHYQNEYLQYDQFFSKNFAWLLLVVVYISVILSSMQVILSTKDVPAVFNEACFVFGVFAMVIILVGIALQVVLFVTLFLYHLVSTIINLEKKGVPWVFSRRR